MSGHGCATSSSRAELAERCEPIELLIVDVDGVLTDGVIAVDDRGAETKHFHVRDGLAFALWHRAGKRSAILSGRRAAAVERRAAELKIAHVLQGGTTQRPALSATWSMSSAWSRGRSATSATTCPTCRCSAPSGWPPARPTPSPRSAAPPTSSPGRREAAVPSARSSRSS